MKPLFFIDILAALTIGKIAQNKFKEQINTFKHTN